MEPVNGINNDVCGTKLQPTSYRLGLSCELRLCQLLNTQYCCLCLNGRLNPPLAAHPSPPHTLLPPTHPVIHAICDNTVAVKKLSKIK